jgi:hypothetical protein
MRKDKILEQKIQGYDSRENITNGNFRETENKWEILTFLAQIGLMRNSHQNLLSQK